MLGSDTVMCVAGDNVDIRGAYVWDGCVVEDDCRLERCLLDTGVRLQRRVHVTAGCVLAQNVRYVDSRYVCKSAQVCF